MSIFRVSRSIGHCGSQEYLGWESPVASVGLSPDGFEAGVAAKRLLLSNGVVTGVAGPRVPLLSVGVVVSRVPLLSVGVVTLLVVTPLVVTLVSTTSNIPYTWSQLIWCGAGVAFRIGHCFRTTNVSVASVNVYRDVWTKSHQLRDKTVRLCCV